MRANQASFDFLKVRSVLEGADSRRREEGVEQRKVGLHSVKRREDKSSPLHRIVSIPEPTAPKDDPLVAVGHTGQLGILLTAVANGLRDPFSYGLGSKHWAIELVGTARGLGAKAQGACI